MQLRNGHWKWNTSAVWIELPCREIPAEQCPVGAQKQQHFCCWTVPWGLDHPTCARKEGMQQHQGAIRNRLYQRIPPTAIYGCTEASAEHYQEGFKHLLVYKIYMYIQVNLHPCKNPGKSQTGFTSNWAPTYSLHLISPSEIT